MKTKILILLTATALMMSCNKSKRKTLKLEDMTNNIMIGERSGLHSVTTKNCVFIGVNAGKDIVEGDGIIIIGDNIHDLKQDNPNVLFIEEKIAIGKTLFGEPINNLQEILAKHYPEALNRCDENMFFSTGKKYSKIK